MEVVVVYGQSTRVTPSERDEAWLANIDEETAGKSTMIDLQSLGGAAGG